MMDIEEVKEIWKGQPDSFPVFLENDSDIFVKVNAKEKKENEDIIEDVLRRIKKKARQRPEKEKLEEQWEEWGQEAEPELREFLKKEKILCLSEWMDENLLNEFQREIKRFLDKVRKFDKELKPEQIWQAMRNYLIYAMIVEMQGETQNAGNPILAYSLLYPYTDNYIDDRGVPKEKKERYNRLIKRKLQGEEAVPESPLEEKTCQLLDLILDSYNGLAREKVAGTLVQLLEAQNCSIGQQKAEKTAKMDAELEEESVLEVSVWKGGTSVLADYLFATADWMEKEERFYLKFGFILQLVDDLQDIEEDGEAGSCTLMTGAAEHWQLEKRVNRLLWFTWNVIKEFEPRSSRLKGFVLKNCVSVSMLAAAMNARFFSKEYIQALEPYLPVSLAFIKKMKTQQSIFKSNKMNEL